MLRISQYLQKIASARVVVVPFLRSWQPYTCVLLLSWHREVTVLGQKENSSTFKDFQVLFPDLLPRQFTTSHKNCIGIIKITSTLQSWWFWKTEIQELEPLPSNSKLSRPYSVFWKLCRSCKNFFQTFEDRWTPWLLTAFWVWTDCNRMIQQDCTTTHPLVFHRRVQSVNQGSDSFNDKKIPGLCRTIKTSFHDCLGAQQCLNVKTNYSSYLLHIKTQV